MSEDANTSYPPPPTSLTNPKPPSITRRWVIISGLVSLLVLSIAAFIPLAQGGDYDALMLTGGGGSSTPIRTPGYPRGSRIIANDQWEPVVQEFDGVPMVMVPPGCFMMGSTDEQIDYAVNELGASSLLEDEQPAHEICFDRPFWLDQYEVSNAQFAEFEGEAERASHWPDPDLPRETITWHEAQAFCEKRGMRLPTEAEWEYAARGPDALIFPWGNEFDGTHLNFCDETCADEWNYDWADNSVNDGYAGTAPIGSYPTGIAWVGAYDLSGNVWEWTSTVYRDYPYVADDGREDSDDTDSRILRGGSWVNRNYDVRSAYRVNNSPDFNLYVIGFRCARDYR